jgi:hypothetical protein
MGARIGFVAVVITAVFGCVVPQAWATGSLTPLQATSSVSSSVAPAWECVPTTAGKAVVSGGDSTSGPDCSSAPAGSLAVLAPTYVKSGVGSQPTVEFSGVNVQIVDGSGHTSTVNGAGNLVLGYDETPGTQTGSHDLILGEGQSYKSYSELVGGFDNKVSGPYTSAFGYDNTVSGTYALSAGDQNTVSGELATVLGGYQNTASTELSSVSGGCSNVAGSGAVSLSSLCSDSTAYPEDFTSISGGAGNQATGISSSLSGGESNLASDPFSTITGGCDNVAGSTTASSGSCNATGVESVLGGQDNTASGPASSVSGGASNTATNSESSVSGGLNNGASSSYGSVSGGTGNNASGAWSSVSGGTGNNASGPLSSVSGGDGNVAGGSQSSISGGWANLADEHDGSILGGCANAVGSTAATDPGCTEGSGTLFDSIAGGYDNLADGGLGSFIAGGNHDQALGSNSLVLGGFESEVASGEGTSMSQFGGRHTVSSTTNNESEVGGTLFSP